MQKPLFKEFAFIVIFVAIINFIAVYKNLYWTIKEFDSLMHFLGGASAVLGTLWAYFFSGFFNPQKRELRHFLVLSLLGLVFVSVAWEVYELFMGVTFVAWREYSFDVTLDFIMDFLGGMAACLYAYMKEIPNVGGAVKVKGQVPGNLPI